MNDPSPYYYAAACVISGIIGGAVAQTKKAPIWPGFCWGFVLGPIGWIIAAIVLQPEPPAAVVVPKQVSIAEKMLKARTIAAERDGRPAPEPPPPARERKH